MFSICVLGSIWSLKPSDFCPLEAESFKVFSTFSTRSPRRRPRDRSFIVIDNIWAVLVGDRVFLVDRRFVVGGFLSSRDCWMVFSLLGLFCGKVLAISKHRRNKIHVWFLFALGGGWVGSNLLGCERIKFIWVKTNSFLSGDPTWHPVDICIWMAVLEPVVHFHHGQMKPLPKKESANPSKNYQKTLRISRSRDENKEMFETIAWPFFVTFLGWWKRDPFKSCWWPPTTQSTGAGLNHLVSPQRASSNSSSLSSSPELPHTSIANRRRCRGRWRIESHVPGW